MTGNRALAGSAAVVTGSGAGIGEGIAVHLAMLGASVAVVDRDGAAVDRLVSTVRGSGGRAVGLTVDVTDSGAPARIVATAVDAFGRLDILVNNVGVGHEPRPLAATTRADVDRLYEVNVRCMIECAAAACPHLPDATGRIVNIGSRSWLGAPGQAEYAATKATTIGFTRSLALELAPRGVTVNAVVPGTIWTPALRSLPEPALRDLVARHPAGRFGEPVDVARAVALFASPAGRFVTGQVLYVCGGRSLHGGPQSKDPRSTQ